MSRGQAVPSVDSGDQPILIILPGLPVVGTDVTNWLYILNRFLLGTIVCVGKASPHGSALVFDLLYSTDLGASWTSIYPSGIANKLIFPTSGGLSSALTVVGELSVGWLLRVDILQIDDGTAHDLTITLVPSGIPTPV